MFDLGRVVLLYPLSQALVLLEQVESLNLVVTRPHSLRPGSSFCSDFSTLPKRNKARRFAPARHVYCSSQDNPPKLSSAASWHCVSRPTTAEKAVPNLLGQLNNVT